MIAVIISLVEKSGYRSFLNELYIEHHNKMLNYAEHILHDEKLAEDAVNEAFMGIIKNVEKIISMDVKKISPYIVISVRNACYNIAKKQKRLANCELLTDRIDEGFFEKSVDEKLTTVDFGYVRKAIKALNGQCRNVVLLRYYEGYSYKEIAAAMDISVGQVGVLLNRAKVRLKEAILAEREIYEEKI